MNEFQKRDPNQFGAGDAASAASDREADAMDVVEGEVGSARLKEPTVVEARGANGDHDRLPQGGPSGAPADDPAGQ